MNKDRETIDKNKKSSAPMYSLAWGIIGPFLCRRFGAVFQPRKLPEGGNLILSNHVTNCDQFLLAVLYKKQMLHFVAGENAFRNRLLRWIAEKKGGVIIHMRGVSSFNTIKQMTGYIKLGENVCIFPEGTTTFDGTTAKVDESISKVAKTAGGNLVLCRIEGGYFARPRWGDNIRKGRTCISEYIISRDELVKMTVKDLTDTINDKLYTNAYEEQKKYPVRFLGRRRGKGLESCLYECPGCGQYGKLHSDNTRLFCSCGFDATYDEYGMLKDGEGHSFTLHERCRTQKEHLKKIVEESKECREERFLFADDLDCKQIDFKGRERAIGRLKLKAFTDRIEYVMDEKKEEIPYSKIKNMYIYLRNTMNIRLDGDDVCYELTGDFSTNALKYRDLLEIVQKN